MAKIAGGYMVLGLLIIFTIFFTSVTAVSNTRSIGAKLYDNSSYASNPGFNSLNNPFLIESKCYGKGQAMSLFGTIPCPRLDIDVSDNQSCNNISGCTWYNVTSIFGFEILPQRCNGYVNMSYYNITGNLLSKSNYCSSDGLQNEEICETFKCPWINNTAQFTQTINQNSEFNTVSFWDSIRWIVTFNMDIGWGNFNWIISALFYFLMLCLFMGIYFMFVPF